MSGDLPEQLSKQTIHRKQCIIGVMQLIHKRSDKEIN